MQLSQYRALPGHGHWHPKDSAYAVSLGWGEFHINRSAGVGNPGSVVQLVGSVGSLMP